MIRTPFSAATLLSSVVPIGVALLGTVPIANAKVTKVVITATEQPTYGGKSFGTVYSWDSPQYPQSSRGSGMAAAGGAVVVNYTASSVPASENATCPCPAWGG